MKLRQLQFAQAVADTGSFSRAADLCNATQPTLSNAISQLEEELGGRLFNRTTRHLDVTPFGQYVLPKMTAILSAKDELVAAARAYYEPAHSILRIGMSPLVDARFVNLILEPFRTQNPETEIFFKECMLEDMPSRLQEAIIDIAIVPSHLMPNSFERASFYSDNLFYLPRHGTNENRSQLKLHEIPDAPIILTGGKCGLDGSLKSLFQTDAQSLTAYPGYALSYQMIMDWAEVGIGAGILPEAKVRDSTQPNIPLFRNNGQPAQIAYEWIWRSQDQNKKEISKAITFIRTELSKVLSAIGPTKL